MSACGTPREAARGLTLVELLVVLAILGAVSVVAVRGVAGFRSRSRFERTQTGLLALRDAIIGSPRATETAALDAFVEDVGRLPTPSADPERALLELWERPTSLAASRLVTDAIDSDVTLAVGWRGPYVDLEPGDTLARDGFGHPFEIDAALDASTWRLVSRGADGVVGGSEEAADLIIPLIDAAAGIDRVRAEVAGSVTLETPTALASWSVVVFAYGPDPANGGLIARAAEMELPSPLPASGPVVVGYRFDGTNRLTLGTRVLRAYVHEPAHEPRAAAIARSAPRRVRLVAGAQTVDLTVPN